MEQGSVRDYNAWANKCSQNADSGTKKIFKGLVDHEERHFAYYETQEDNIETFGEQFLTLQSIECSKKIENESALEA